MQDWILSDFFLFTNTKYLFSIFLSGGNIANIASLRQKKSTNAATVLLQILQGKGNICHLMSSEDRDFLARSIQKLLRATYALPDPEGWMSKLRIGLDGLVLLSLNSSEVAVGGAGAIVGVAGSTVGIVGGKRSSSNEEDGEGENACLDI